LLDNPKTRSEDDKDKDVGAMGAVTRCSGGVTGAGAHAGAMTAREDGCSCPTARSLCLVQDEIEALLLDGDGDEIEALADLSSLSPSTATTPTQPPSPTSPLLTSTTRSFIGEIDLLPDGYDRECTQVYGHTIAPSSLGMSLVSAFEEGPARAARTATRTSAEGVAAWRSHDSTAAVAAAAAIGRCGRG
jgi:hypothetical protein